MSDFRIRQSVGWLAAELLVVIVGILLAIGIDSWWASRANQAAEQDLLRDLAAEFARNDSLLEWQFSFYERRRAAAETLLELGPGAADLPLDSLDILWQYVTRGGSFDPDRGVFDAAISSGDINRSQDSELRARLASWPSATADLRDVEDLVDVLLFTQFLPWIREQTALPGGYLGELGVPGGRNVTDYRLLSSSVVAENYLREITGWGRILLKLREDLRVILDEVSAHLTENLSD